MTDVTADTKDMGAAEATTSAAVSMSAFFTRQPSNEGIRVPLFLPDGTPTEHHLTIRGRDSDEFRMAEMRANREMMAIARTKNADDRLSAQNELTLRTLASLVRGWSFEHECTPQAAYEFLREAPQIADAIDKVSARRTFFKMSSEASSSSSHDTSSSSI